MLTTGVVFLIAFLLIAGYGIHHAVFPLIDLAYHNNIFSAGNSIWWTNINSVLLNAPKVIAAATAIKLVKHWYFKQKEKELLEKEKLITDLQLMKAQIRPDFLFSSLDQIYESAQRKLPEAPELLLKLADLLSYLLYDCDETKVSLEKELTMMKEYIALEKARYTNKLEVQVAIKGDLLNKKISPLLLLPFIENSFKHCSQSEQPWINLEFNVEKETLSMKLINGLSLTDTDSAMHDTTTVEKRLQLLYEEKYELKKYAEEEIYVVLLKINLSEKSKIKSSTNFKSLNSKDLKNEYVSK
jgi:LytS/YehU family sensor histidine kinase